MNVQEPDLLTVCKETTQNQIHILGVNAFYASSQVPTLSLDLSTHCPKPFSSGSVSGSLQLINCPTVGNHIMQCQEMGKQILIVIENKVSPLMQTDADGIFVAMQIWNLFLGGQSAFRPFGAAVCDGVMLHILDGVAGYAALAKTLRSFFANATMKFLLAGRTGCSFPDAFCGPVYNGTLLARFPSAFDYVVIDAGSSPCGWINEGTGLFAFALLQWTDWFRNIVHSLAPVSVVVSTLSGYPSAGDFVAPTNLNLLLQIANFSGISGFHLDSAGQALKNLFCLQNVSSVNTTVISISVNYVQAFDIATKCFAYQTNSCLQAAHAASCLKIVTNAAQTRSFALALIVSGIVAALYSFQ